MNATSPALDLETAWDLARNNFAWPDYQALMAIGISKAICARLVGYIGADDISIADGRWSRRYQGERAFVLPVVGPSGEVVDLVAFRPETPKSFWLCSGSGVPMLGYESLLRAEHESDVLREDGCPQEWMNAVWSKGVLTVHECPLDWLKAEGAGVCILDWNHYWPAYFTRVAALRAADLAFGKRLTRLLERPLQAPDVLVQM